MDVQNNLNLGLGRKLPSILQTEAAECGLACIAMIANYHGNGSPLPELRRKHGVSLKGATLEDLMKIGDQIGFSSRPLRLELNELQQLSLPCILHWDLNHFVVLAKVGSTSVVVHDPAMGVRRLSLQAVSEHFTGVALELTPLAKFEKKAAGPSLKLSQLFGHVRGLWGSLGLVFCLALAIEVFTIVSPFFLSWVIDHALVSADRDLLTTLAIGFTLVLLLRVATTALRSWVLMGLSSSLNVQSRANLFTHLLNLPASYFESRYLGDVMSRFESQDTILKGITTQLVEAILDGLMAAITLGMMFLFAPSLAIVVVIGAVVYALMRWLTYRPLKEATTEAIVWEARRDTHFLETLRGIRSVKLSNGQENRRTHWLNLLVQAINRRLTTEKIQLVMTTLNTFLSGFLTILVVLLGARQVLASTLSVGLLMAFISYKDQFLERVSELINKLVELRMLRIHADRLADIALSEPERRGEPVRETTGDMQPVSVEFRNVSFRYSETDPWVLKNINLKIAAGESVAICGPSGGGKSTLLKLLSGLLQPVKGEILIDGLPLRQLGLDRYRLKIGVVMQDDQLFAGSISDNIASFSGQPNQEFVEACAKLAAIDSDIRAMPMGYNTLIGDMGTVLSGGQKQRVLLARAVYKQPGMLLLDEATSHLDIDREQAVNEAMNQLPLTRVIIAHRPDTIRSAGRVIVLSDGEVKGQVSPSWTGGSTPVAMTPVAPASPQQPQPPQQVAMHQQDVGNPFEPRPTSPGMQPQRVFQPPR